MAGITLAQAEAKLTLWLAADDAVASNQSYDIAGRSYTRADAETISKNIDKWNRIVQRLSRGGLSYKGVTPII
jgi:hypothetical protein